MPIQSCYEQEFFPFSLSLLSRLDLEYFLSERFDSSVFFLFHLFSYFRKSYFSNAAPSGDSSAPTAPHSCLSRNRLLYECDNVKRHSIWAKQYGYLCSEWIIKMHYNICHCRMLAEDSAEMLISALRLLSKMIRNTATTLTAIALEIRNVIRWDFRYWRKTVPYQLSKLQTGCFHKTIDGKAQEICCCNKDMCNKNSSATTLTFAILLVTVATVIASLHWSMCPYFHYWINMLENDELSEIL